MFQRIKSQWLRWKRDRRDKKTIEESGGIPTTLAETYPAMAKTLGPEKIEQIHRGTEDDISRLHFGFGMWMRNNWHLWSVGPLVDWFKRHGIHHADDMSGIILTSFYRQLHGKPIQLEEQVEKYRAHWKRAGLDPDTMKKVDS